MEWRPLDKSGSRSQQLRLTRARGQQLPLFGCSVLRWPRARANGVGNSSMHLRPSVRSSSLSSARLPAGTVGGFGMMRPGTTRNWWCCYQCKIIPWAWSWAIFRWTMQRKPWTLRGTWPKALRCLCIPFARRAVQRALRARHWARWRPAVERVPRGWEAAWPRVCQGGTAPSSGFRKR